MFSDNSPEMERARAIVEQFAHNPGERWKPLILLIAEAIADERQRIARRVREGHQTPCLSALASGAACQPDSFKRCAICGFVVDLKFAAEKPTVRK